MLYVRMNIGTLLFMNLIKSNNHYALSLLQSRIYGTECPNVNVLCCAKLSLLNKIIGNTKLLMLFTMHLIGFPAHRIPCKFCMHIVMK